MRRSALANLSGLTGEVNVQGEAGKKLDQFTNSVFVQMMEESQLVCQIVSEEMEEVLRIGEDSSGAK
jgi:fructose-1,6-bisphosphatase I